MAILKVAVGLPPGDTDKYQNYYIGKEIGKECTPSATIAVERPKIPAMTFNVPKTALHQKPTHVTWRAMRTASRSLTGV